VVRVNRDLFRRSRVGGIFTRRDPVVATKAGASGPDNLAYGVDGLVNPTNDISIVTYAAKTETEGKSGKDTSYRGRFDWTPDKYGISAEYLTVGTNFNPELGFLRRTAFTRSYGQGRYSPRPGWRGIRKIYFLGSVDYITDPSYRPESKETQGNYQMDLENGDGFSSDVSRNYERLTTRFDVGNGVFIPPGGAIGFQNHYTPYGKEVVDKSQIGLYFYDKDKTPDMVMHNSVIADQSISIPPGEERHTETAYITFPKDALLYSGKVM